MIRIQIRNSKSNNVTHQADFKTQEDADNWVALNEAVKSWGRPAVWLSLEELKRVGLKVEDSEGVRTQGTGTASEVVQYFFSSEYVVTQEDVSAEYAERQIEANIQKAAQLLNKLATQFKKENALLFATETGNVLALKKQIFLKVQGVLESITSGDPDLFIDALKSINPAQYDAVYISEARLLQYANLTRVAMGKQAVATLAEA